jgi:RND family efflux transporter MFP subunit
VTKLKGWIVAAVIAAAVVGWVAYKRHAGSSEAIVAPGASTAPTQAVTAVPAQIAKMVDSVTSYGNMVAVRSVNIVPDRPGQVEKILFKDGKEVAAGTPLVVLDSRIAAAQVQASRAKADTDQQNLRRTQELRGQGLDSTYSLEQARSQAAASQADLSINLQKLDQLTLRAPFSGTLGTRLVDEGAFLNGGETIVRLDDTSALQIEFRMPSGVAQQAVEGMPVHVGVPGVGNDIPVEGKLSFIDPAISTDTRSALLRAVVPNAGHNLRPGLFVRVRLDLDVHQNALVVPAEAVGRDLGGAYVFVVDGNNISRKRDVEVGLSDGTSVELTSGVKAGELVVTVGLFRLRDGDPVKIVADSTRAKGSS